MVHANAEGKPRAVFAIRIDPGKAPSAFVTSFPAPFIGFNETTAYDDTQLDLLEPLREVSMLTEFWTYKGSLTSPPCEEGIRWFVARTVMYVGIEQMQQILHVSTYSARVEQQVSIWYSRGICGVNSNGCGSTRSTSDPCVSVSVSHYCGLRGQRGGGRIYL